MKNCKIILAIAFLLIIGTGQLAFSAGSLFNPPTSNLVGTYPTSVAIADVNNDGHLDLVSSNDNSQNLSVLLGYGDGTFTGRINYALPGGQSPYDVEIADMDKDGNLDLITGGWFGINIFYGVGDGTFGTPVSTSGNAVNYVAVADFNGDSFPDIAATNPVLDSVAIYLNNGDSTFSVSSVKVGQGSLDIVAAKLDIDSYIDLAVTCKDGTIWNLRNNGNGIFNPNLVGSLTCQYCSSFLPYITAADFYDNGVSDLAVGSWMNDSVYIYLNNGDGTYQIAYKYEVGLQPSSIIAHDFDCDSTVDLIVANKTSQNIQFLKGQGHCIFTPDSTYSLVSGAPAGLACGDLDEDGSFDLAVASTNDDQVYVFINAIDLALGITDIANESLPQTYTLEQNYPNPFNPDTKIRFTLPTSSHVKIEVFNLLGQSVKVLADEELSAGTKEVTWDGLDSEGSPVSSGIYFYRLVTDNFVDTKKMLMLK